MPSSLGRNLNKNGRKRSQGKLPRRVDVIRYAPEVSPTSSAPRRTQESHNIRIIRRKVHEPMAGARLRTLVE